METKEVKKKTTTVKAQAEIYKQISCNPARNMQEVIMREGGDAYYTRHIALDPKLSVHPKRRTFGKTNR